jgi:hypothetical protein
VSACAATTDIETTIARTNTFIEGFTFKLL